MARIVDVDLPIFDPLSYTNLGAATAEALFERKPVPMSQLPHFRGEGVYAIYYCGDFEPYKVISEANADDQWAMPIYVGKADPPGAREGSKTIVPEQGKSQSMVCQERALRDRLQGHVRSIEAATSTLNIEHFWCRFLLVNQVLGGARRDDDDFAVHSNLEYADQWLRQQRSRRRPRRPSALSVGYSSSWP